MSGGANKRKPHKVQGWEEAGSEFYQESYPTDAELDALQRDAKHLATLLPSKQNRAVAATTTRIRTNGNRTIRRQTSTRSRRESTVARRASTTADVQVSMLPDLSQNLSNEETIWDEIMQIKAMPVPMAQKKDMKAKILNEPNLRLQGYEQFKWKRRKIWRQFQARLHESYTNLELWKNDLKRIEGYFGTGVVTYFLFLKWLLYLNLFIFLLIFLFITLPTILVIDYGDECPPLNDDTDKNVSIGTSILDFIQGTGFMECSVLFYQFYPNRTLEFRSNGNWYYYNLPLAYILITLLYFILSLIFIVRSSVRGFRDRLVEGEGQFYQYCNLIFGGWDFCINNMKSATIKHNALYYEIKGCLEQDRHEMEKQNRTRNEKIKLFFTRFVINFIVVGVLSGCGSLIYYIYTFCSDWLEKDPSCTRDIEHLFYEFLPAIVIVCLNILVPFIFNYVIQFESYNPIVQIRLTLFRTVLLRFASLIVFYATLNNIITKKKRNLNQCKEIQCWETYVGQQIYKLVLTDFATHILLTFFINLPRAFLARHFTNNFVKFIGEQSFDLPKHVLDVVYFQTLCWFGSFYAPLLSVMFAIIFFLMFQIKKVACLWNSKPSATIYRASRSKSMFMTILLIAFVFATVPFAYSISELRPSEQCGPFRNLTTVWMEIQEMFNGTPNWLQDIFYFLGTSGFAVPVIILLLLLVYYYHAINEANRHMVEVLKNQLVLEGHDKQFLLERLSKFIKQQENQKRLRHVELMQDGDTNISN